MNQNDFNSQYMQENSRCQENTDHFRDKIDKNTDKNIKSEKVHKLKGILNKNLQLKSFFMKRQTTQNSQNIHKNTQQTSKHISLPLIKTYEEQNSQQNSIKSINQKQTFCSIQNENPQIFSQKFNKSPYKLNIKLLTLKNYDKTHIFQEKHFIKPNLNNSVLKEANTQRLDQIQLQKLKQKNQDRRRKQRNVRSLKLTKIQHLPQIIFTQNQNCSKNKFFKYSMAEIDNNILVNEINELQRNRTIEMRQRQKSERMLKVKIKNYQQKRMSYLFDNH